jgi:hypothetical protein
MHEDLRGAGRRHPWAERPIFRGLVSYRLQRGIHALLDFGAHRKEGHVVGLGIVTFIVGVVLWITVLPAIGWVLMGIGVLLILVGLLIGAVWTLGRAVDRRTY